MEENLKFHPSVKENFLGIIQPKQEDLKKQQTLHPQEYESGLEVVQPLPWSPNDAPLLEVAPPNQLDAKTLSTPQVIEDPKSWHDYHVKKHPGLEAAASPTTLSAMSPGGYSTTLYGSHPDGFPHSHPHNQHPEGFHRQPTPESKSVDGFGLGPRVCGMSRKAFYIVTAVAMTLVITAIAVGLGAGLASRGRSSSNNDGSSSRTIPTGVRSTSSANITCPAADNSTFSAQNSPDRLFRLICGHDYNSEDGSIDLASENATTMASCIDLCAAEPECVGAGWGDYYGYRLCWMKSRLGKPNVSGNWLFAVDLNGTDVSTLP
ncbi:uncharacterized protein CTRU02_213609 [Colletotrichum truncatum]|uniref:Uncharacterized protein n=1 Tax=Colletotrichum truncatum TaxID=5467 RepID=A0ACC3YG65_COLTU|nr:uncharacterized protein CTRU02_11818 [Colletotrichum truncatum]KAF6785517.1 hypothetical protein CTRU02_11818 [Colletotrichum truncatum]